jgi:hypothetical protein
MMPISAFCKKQLLGNVVRKLDYTEMDGKSRLARLGIDRQSDGTPV